MSQDPDLKLGLQYWDTQDATIDGVLGGFGEGPLPRVESLGSRRFLLSIRNDLCRVPSVFRRLDAPALDAPRRRVRALDVGAGIGRVTACTLLPLVDDVVLVEPAEHFFLKAMEDCPNWEGISDLTKSVTFVRTPLQSFDPSQPVPLESTRMGLGADLLNPEIGYDIIWCQWCLGHLTDPDLVKFLKQAKKALREPEDLEYPRGAGVIIIKENTTEDGENGEAIAIYAEDDSSVTRSDAAWKQIFNEAGLSLIKEEVQEGLPEGLLEVKS
ncbi:unnamed protein product [Rhizoctonia solani]|uniref:Alpha N-terminal protein methyltransferase 1 n=1 Tax=Rhizoctonia solani TaxID=456999 RepID=A0A8H3A5Q7_9AGAM|nr:AdoMet-dependent proline di-methyltransferase [Rhizoctonia solani]QRW27490.1 AdoMet-dependent proline di-methyltransferase [Rhizoctonia solani]CAE6407180.1 unnamed protein product [Rhizoctonia solani]